jgi:hypothetical protein
MKITFSIKHIVFCFSISRNKKEPKTSTQRSKEYRERIKLRQADASATTISSNAKTER